MVNKKYGIVSFFYKDEISLDLLLDTYYEMKVQNQRPTFWNYTDEGLIYAGFNKENIKRIRGY